jgi:hypothetical protein
MAPVLGFFTTTLEFGVPALKRVVTCGDGLEAAMKRRGITGTEVDRSAVVEAPVAPVAPVRPVGVAPAGCRATNGAAIRARATVASGA